MTLTPKSRFSPRDARPLTKQLVSKLDLARDANPQTYGIGVKELWEVPSGASRGEVIYTLGGRLRPKNTAVRGFTAAKITSSRWDSSPDSTIPIRGSIRTRAAGFQTTSMVAKLLEGGKMIRYGAKSMPYGGWWRFLRSPAMGG